MKEGISTQKIPTSDVGVWMTAMRLRTIPIPTIQVVVGTSLAYAMTGAINWTILLFTWLISVFITIGTNLINDVIDFDKGGDKIHRIGHPKMIRAGLISRNTMFFVGLGSLVLSVLCAIPIAVHVGWWAVPLVAFSALIGYCYTGGPFPICYLGLSEIFILIFYGFICVGASFYAQTGFMSWTALISSLQMGMLAILPNALNNFRDMHEDEEVNKQTLAVRFGASFARREIAVLTTIPFLLNGFCPEHMDHNARPFI